MRLVTVNDLSKAEVASLFQVLRDTNSCSDLKVTTVMSMCMKSGDAKEMAQAQFKVRPTNLTNVIKTLTANGFYVFDVQAVLTTTEQVPAPNVPLSNMSWLGYRLGGTRISTLEMHTNISGNTSFSIDHGFLIMIACCLAAFGLIMDSPVNILAAFFVSPLMNMILVTSWGLVIRDYQLARRGMTNVVLGASMAWIVGAFIGIFLSRVPGVFMMEHNDGRASINSSQILARGPPASMAWGGTTVIASISGITIALGQSTGVTGALAGVTMAASLLPPLVNSGMMFVLGIMFPKVRTTHGDSLHAVAIVSLGIYVVTVPLVIFWAFTVFKLKHVGGRSLFMSTADNTRALAECGVVPDSVTERRKANSLIHAPSNPTLSVFEMPIRTNTM